MFSYNSYGPATNRLGFIFGNTEPMTIFPNGNVGIGTTSPDTLLHIYSNTTNPIIHLQRAGATNNPNYIISADETLGGLNF